MSAYSISRSPWLAALFFCLVAAKTLAEDFRTAELTPLLIKGQPLAELDESSHDLNHRIRSLYRLKLKEIDAPGSRIEDLAYQLPGAQMGVEDSGFSTSLILRGFQPTSRQGIHGFRGMRTEFNGLPDIQRLFTRDLFTLEAVEVLSGPDALSQGLANPGGRISYQGKQPQFDPSTFLGIETNAYAPFYNTNGTRLSLDTTGPINDQFAYRFIAVNQNQDIQPNHFSSQRGQLLGGLTWRYSPKGSIRLESEYQENRQPYLFGSILLNEEPVYGHYYASPDQSSKRQYQRYAVYWSQQLRLNDRQTLVLDARYAHAQVDRDEELIGFSEQNLAPDAEYLIGYHTQLEDDYQQDSWRLKAHWQLNNTKRQQQLVFFADQHDESFRFNRRWASTQFKLAVAERDFIPLDRSSLKPVSLDSLSGFSWLDQNTNQTRGYGVAYQIDTHLAQREFTASAGLRYNQFENQMLRWQFQDQWTSQGDLPTTIETDAFSWQWGARSELNAPFYFQVAQSFAGFPQESDRVDDQGSFLNPEKLALTELGLHYLDGSQQQASLVAYQLKRSDLAQQDERYSADDWAELGYVPYRLAGRQKNRGIETRYSVQQDRWHLNLNSNYITQFKDSSVDSENNLWPGVARLTAGGRLAYTRPLSHQRYWRTWLAGQYQSKRYADRDNSLSVPAFYRLDAGLVVNHQNTRLSLSVTNLLDKKYVSYLSSVTNVYQSDRRRIWLSASSRF